MEKKIKESIMNISMSKEDISNFIDVYLNNNGWKDVTSDIKSFKKRIKEMYIKEYYHSYDLNKRLKKLNSLSKFSFLGVIGTNQKFSQLKELKTDEEILIHSINNVNLMFNRFISVDNDKQKVQ